MVRPVLCRLKDVYAEKDKIIPENEKWLLCRFCFGAVLQAEFDIYVVFFRKDFDELVCCLTDGDGNVISCVDKYACTEFRKLLCREVREPDVD